jgi:hypothetical protein
MLGCLPHSGEYPSTKEAPNDNDECRVTNDENDEFQRFQWPSAMWPSLNLVLNCTRARCRIRSHQSSAATIQPPAYGLASALALNTVNRQADLFAFLKSL